MPEASLPNSPQAESAKKEVPVEVVSDLYAVESGNRVFMPSKLTTRTDRASVLLKFSLIEAIKQK